MTESIGNRRMVIIGSFAFAASCLLVLVGALARRGAQAANSEDAVLAVGFTALGAVVLARQPGNRAGLLCLTSVLAALAYAADGFVGLALHHNLPGVAWAAWLASWAWVPGMLPVLTLLLLVLPDGRLPHPRWRPVAWLLAVVMLAMSVLLALTPAAPGELPNPVGVAAIAPLRHLDEAPIVAVVLACALAGLGGLAQRLVGSRGIHRVQLGWVVLGATVFVLGSILNEALPEPLRGVVVLGAAVALPLAYGVAILRYGLLQLTGLLRRLLLTVVLVSLLVAAYLGLRAVLGTAVVPATVTAVGLAVATPALRAYLDGRVRRLVYGARGSPGEVLATLVRRLATATGPDDVLAALASVVEDVLPVTAVHVVLISDDRELRRISRGPADAQAGEIVVLRFDDFVLGRVEIAPSAPLDSSDRELLADLIVAASAAVAAAHRTVELHRARGQLVTAREQERRRIAQDLHDGVGPILSGLGFMLDALRTSVRGIPDADIAAVRARAQVREAVQLIRRVARGLRPPGLDQLGLVGAVQELAARHRGSSLAVHVSVTGELAKLGAAAEVAAYAIVAEALTNVARHAAASTCRITLGTDEDMLIVRVEDDGIGLDGAPAGLGRLSMGERAEELGGWCRICTAPAGGTCVEAQVPVGPTNADVTRHDPIGSARR